MQITVEREQEDVLREFVATGRFSSVEEAVRAAIDQLRFAEDDLSWAKPLVDEAIAEIERGESIPSGRVFQELREKLNSSK